MNGDFLQMTIQSLVAQSPVLIVYTIGLIIAIVKYGKHPKPAMLVLLSMIGFFVASFLVTVITNYMIAEGNFGPPLTAINVFGSVLRAGCLVMLICAAFSYRTTTRSRRDDYDDRDDRDDDRPRPVAQLRRNPE